MACAYQVSKQHLDTRGVPLDGASLYCYADGETELHNTFSDPEMTIMNTNPIILDDRGSCKVYWDGSPVTFMLYDTNGNLVENWWGVVDSGESIAEHIQDRNNPHQVTASQVGAYTTTQVDSHIKNYGLLMRNNGTNTLQFYRPEL